MKLNPTRVMLFAAAAAFACTLTTTVHADDDFKLDLSIGDKAPAIDIEHWVKGDKVKEFEKGKVYVVEFWATWCGPCVQSMPHLSSLQKEYADKGVTIIGISDEDLGTVKGFLKKTYTPESKTHDARVQYTLTTDPDKSAKKAYMDGAQQQGIPTAFLVGKTGKIEWIGHPMELDDVLKQVVEDKWDAKEFKVSFEASAQLDAMFGKGDVAGARKLLTKLIKEHPENTNFLQMQFMVEMQMGEFDNALKTLDKVEKIMGEDAGIGTMRAKIFCLKKDYDAAFKVLAKEVKANWDDADVLNQIAWFLVDDESLEKRDLKLALKAAERACELTKNSEAAVLDTLARAHYELGNLDEAVKWQTKAVESLGKDAGGPMGDSLRDTLDNYKQEAAKKKA